MGAHDRGHVPGLERLELKPAGAIASLDRHRVTSRLWSRETGIPIRLWVLPDGERSTGTARAADSSAPDVGSGEIAAAGRSSDRHHQYRRPRSFLQYLAGAGPVRRRDGPGRAAAPAVRSAFGRSPRAGRSALSDGLPAIDRIRSAGAHGSPIRRQESAIGRAGSRFHAPRPGFTPRSRRRRRRSGPGSPTRSPDVPGGGDVPGAGAIGSMTKAWVGFHAVEGEVALSVAHDAEMMGGPPERNRRAPASWAR